MMTTKQQKIIAKIKKCLALSQSSNANEAGIALAQAHKLMKEYDISLGDIAAAEASEAHCQATVKNKPTEWENALAVAVAKALDCLSGFQSTLKPSGRGRWLFIGIEPAPDLAKYAFETLLRQLKKDRAEYAKTLKRFKPANQRAKALAYCEGWVYAVYEKVKGLRPSDKAETAITAYMDKHYSQREALKTRESAKTKVNVGKDAAIGYQQGKNAILNQPINAQQKAGELEAL